MSPRRGRFEKLIRDPAFSLVAVRVGDPNTEVDLGPCEPESTVDTIAARLPSGRWTVYVTDPVSGERGRLKHLSGTGGAPPEAPIAYASAATPAGVSDPRIAPPRIAGPMGKAWSDAHDAAADAARKRAEVEGMKAELEREEIARKLELARDRSKPTGASGAAEGWVAAMAAMGDRVSGVERRVESAFAEIRTLLLQRPAAPAESSSRILEQTIASVLRRNPMEDVAAIVQLMGAMAPRAAPEGPRTSPMATLREMLAVQRELRDSAEDLPAGGGGRSGVWDAVAALVAKRLSEEPPRPRAPRPVAGAAGLPTAPAGALPRIVSPPSGSHPIVAGGPIAAPPPAGSGATVVRRAGASAQTRLVALVEALEAEMANESDPATVVELLEPAVGLLPPAMRETLYGGTAEAVLDMLATNLPDEVRDRLAGAIASPAAQKWLVEFLRELQAEPEGVEGEPAGVGANGAEGEVDE